MLSLSSQNKSRSFWSRVFHSFLKLRPDRDGQRFLCQFETAMKGVSGASLPCTLFRAPLKRAVLSVDPAKSRLKASPGSWGKPSGGRFTKEPTSCFTSLLFIIMSTSSKIFLLFNHLILFLLACHNVGESRREFISCVVEHYYGKILGQVYTFLLWKIRYKTN